jgi:hypothetical protein
LLRSLILIIVFVLLLLCLLLLPLPLINGENVECKANQPAFVCYTSTGMKMTLSNKLVLW